MSLKCLLRLIRNSWGQLCGTGEGSWARHCRTADTGYGGSVCALFEHRVRNQWTMPAIFLARGLLWRRLLRWRHLCDWGPAQCARCAIATAQQPTLLQPNTVCCANGELEKNESLGVIDTYCEKKKRVVISFKAIYFDCIWSCCCCCCCYCYCWCIIFVF